MCADVINPVENVFFFSHTADSLHSPFNHPIGHIFVGFVNSKIERRHATFNYTQRN